MKNDTDLVISRQNLPSSFRFGALVAYWLLLAHFNAPTWAFYLFYAFAVIVTIGAAVRMFNTTQIDLTTAAEIQKAARMPLCCRSRETEPAVQKNSYTLTAAQIHYERFYDDRVRVTLRDANGKELYRFPDHDIHHGTALTLTGMRVEVDLNIT